MPPSDYLFLRDCQSVESCEEPGRRKTQEPGCDILYPLRFLSSRNIWSNDPDINNNTISNESLIQFGGPERNLYDGQHSKTSSGPWKTVDGKKSGQLNTLGKDQADLLNLFSKRITELEGYLTQNKTMTAEGANRVSFET